MSDTDNKSKSSQVILATVAFWVTLCIVVGVGYLTGERAKQDDAERAALEEFADEFTGLMVTINLCNAEGCRVLTVNEVRRRDEMHKIAVPKSLLNDLGKYKITVRDGDKWYPAGETSETTLYGLAECLVFAYCKCDGDAPLNQVESDSKSHIGSFPDRDEWTGTFLNSGGAR